MSITFTIGSTLRINGLQPVSGSGDEAGSVNLSHNQVYPASTVNTRVAFSFTTATLQAFFIKADQDMTLTTNGVNEVQQIATTGTVTAGTFTLTYSGQTTAAIQWNAAASAVQSALIALSNIGPNDVVCTGGPLPGTPVVCTFTGALGNTNVAAMTSTDTLTGGSTSLSTTTAGVAPSNTIALKAGRAFPWEKSDGYYASPFTVDVTSFSVTCATASRLQFEALTS